MKIILIDDRTKRQVKYTEDTGVYLERFSEILENYTAEKYEILLEEFNAKDYSTLEKFDVIITHRSAFGDNNSIILDKIKELCAKSNKTLVFFSGGISNTTFISKPFEFLLMNSKDFYSKNIELYLENPISILQLAYGNKYVISLLLNILEKINIFVTSNLNEKNISFRKFKRETRLEAVSHLIKVEEPNSSVISINELQKISTILTKEIKDQVVLNV